MAVNVSLNEISYALMEAYRANVVNTDEIDIRWLQFLVHTTRAKLLKQNLDKPFSQVDEHCVQSFAPAGEPVSMELVDSSASSTLPSNRYMCRTSVAIPATLESNKSQGTFTRIANADRLDEEYTYVSYEHALLYGNGKFNKNSVCAFLLGDRLYLMSKNKQSIFGVKYLDIRGVFQNPVEVATTNDPTWTEDDDYPVNVNMVNDIIIYILKNEFGVTYKPPVDTDPINTKIVNKEEE